MKENIFQALFAAVLGVIAAYLNVLLVPLITLAGSALGTFAGIFLNTKLSNYRIEQLEKKVDKHNNLIERTYRLE